ncbi:MAG: carboxypeptidase-like regulatory domain-containing protein [Bacteroidales bacterium]
MAKLTVIKYLLSVIMLSMIFADANTQQERRQQDPLQISGIISDEFNDPLPYSHIIILNAGKGSIADRRGRFSFIVYPNDTLIFSSLGHKRKQVVIPADLDVVHYSFDVKLERDTFEIKEVTVFPWATYEEFSEAFIALDLPEDDYDRAIANIALIQTWMELEGLPLDPGASFKTAMQQHYYRNMYAGQPPNNLLNPFSWAQFIQAIREGKFQRR